MTEEDKEKRKIYYRLQELILEKVREKNMKEKEEEKEEEEVASPFFNRWLHKTNFRECWEKKQDIKLFKIYLTPVNDKRRDQGTS